MDELIDLGEEATASVARPSVGSIPSIGFFRHVRLIPVFATVIFAITCIVPFITSLVSGRKFPLTIPTVSESAREFPGSRIFNIGSTVAGLLIAIVGWIMTDLPSLYTTPLPVLVKALPVMTGAFFVLVSGFGLDDNVFVHLTCALVGFFSLVIFSVFMFGVLDHMRVIMLRTLKLVFMGLGIVALVTLALTWAGSNEDPIGSIKALAEFCFILFFAMYIGSWYKELEDVEIVMKVDG